MKHGKISVFVINDEFTVPLSERGRPPFDEFRDEYLAAFDSDAYRFPASTGDWDDQRWKSELDLAVAAARAKAPDVVLLDVHFGPYGASRLGVNHALPGLLASGFPVIVFSKFEGGVEIYEQIQRLPGIVRFLSHERLGELAEHIQAVRSFSARAKTEVGLGFGFRDASAIAERRAVQAALERVMTASDFEPIEVPLVTHVEDFIGPVPRPIANEKSNRLFSSIVREGRAMAVRYEGTALVAKYVASNLLASRVAGERKAWRYSYFQEMVRVEAPEELDNRHLRSFYQAGWELFTTDTKFHGRQIADSIVASLSLPRELGLRARVRVSDVRLIETLLGELRVARKDKNSPDALTKYERKMLVVELEKEPNERDLESTFRRVGLDESHESVKLLAEMSRHQECELAEGLRFVASVAGKRPAFQAAVRELSTVAAELQGRTSAGEVLFDPGVHRSLNFYSGATFQGDLVDEKGVVLFRPSPSGVREQDLKGREWLGGGVFTGLVESFGVTGPVYSVGAAAGVERLTAWIRKLREEGAHG